MSDDELLQYLSFRQGTHLNYHRAAGIGIQDFDRLILQATKFVQQDLPTSVLRTRNDNESLLELSIRYLLLATAGVNHSGLLIDNRPDNGQDMAHPRTNLRHSDCGRSSHPSGTTFRSP